MALSDLTRQLQDALNAEAEARAKIEEAQRQQRAKETAAKESQDSLRAYLEELLRVSSLTGKYHRNVVDLYLEVSDQPQEAYIGLAIDILSHPFVRPSGDVRAMFMAIHDMIGDGGLGLNDLWLHSLLLSMQYLDIYAPKDRKVAIKLALDWASYTSPAIPDNLVLHDRLRLTQAIGY